MNIEGAGESLRLPSNVIEGVEMRILNNGKRAFIVKKASLLSGGEKIKDSDDYAINPGETADVTDACGKILKTYSEIRVLGGGKSRKDVDESDIK